MEGIADYVVEGQRRAGADQSADHLVGTRDFGVMPTSADGLKLTREQYLFWSHTLLFPNSCAYNMVGRRSKLESSSNLAQT